MSVSNRRLNLRSCRLIRYASSFSTRCCRSVVFPVCRAPNRRIILLGDRARLILFWSALLQYFTIITSLHNYMAFMQCRLERFRYSAALRTGEHHPIVASNDEGPYCVLTRVGLGSQRGVVEVANDQNKVSPDFFGTRLTSVSFGPEKVPSPAFSLSGPSYCP